MPALEFLEKKSSLSLGLAGVFWAPFFGGFAELDVWVAALVGGLRHVSAAFFEAFVWRSLGVVSDKALRLGGMMYVLNFAEEYKVLNSDVD